MDVDMVDYDDYDDCYPEDELFEDDCLCDCTGSCVCYIE